MTARRESIVEAAAELFAERGYEATPVAEIARRAGVSEGAIFRHFPSKEQLLLRILTNIRKRFFAYFEQHHRFVPGEAGLDMVLRLTRLFCGFYEEREQDFDCIQQSNPYRVREVGEECRAEIARVHDKMIELLEVAISLGSRDGSLAPGPVAERALLVHGLLMGMVRLRLFAPERHLRELEPELLRLVADGLRGPSLR
ncbi:transcriptional regulator, TetR family [Desulfovibrio sp. X2]|uniref:TetR/AcrR family transcriptional regulator n=1 Tax=Desulfovibrio sp. X2 TaxID=941449 RepID=UPI000358A3AA|nr:TetR/AcrR family transcriptional regulator [Desulfovibrio sp. X2]EPR36319.1 transcriptional regulator, TetR family [Desulfovibrio sp. X2]